MGGPLAVLRELSVQNLALIEDVRIEIQGGYCAWTGETGAGKSLLLTALGLVLGGKASADLVRSGKEEARAAAVFEIQEPNVRADVEALLGGPIDDDQLILTRRISAQGRGAAHANGLPVPVATLRKLGQRLIDVHGQHETQTLLDPDRQRTLLDTYGELVPLLLNYQKCRSLHEGLRKRRLALIEAAEERRRELALLTFERDELAAAEPKPGEYVELHREAQRLANAEALREAVNEGHHLLYEADQSVQTLLKRVARKLEPLAGSIPEFAEAAETLHRLAEETKEVAYGLRDFGADQADAPGRLDAIESRLALYRKLASRFRCEPNDLAARQEAIEERLAQFDQEEADLAQLDGPLADAWESLKNASKVLSEARSKTCKAFAKAVLAHLKDLNLGGAKLSVEVTTRPLGDDPTSLAPEAGADQVEMVFAPNPGEPPRPLRKIASGGELSRLTLAIKTVLAGADGVPTLVFDEIDTGVGGRLGAVLGRKLSALAEHHQVICVTHLPQMASYASHQWVIRKRTVKGRTRTTIEPLVASEQRVEELAAMLRGDSAAEGTRLEALAMLAEAQESGAR